MSNTSRAMFSKVTMAGSSLGGSGKQWCALPFLISQYERRELIHFFFHRTVVSVIKSKSEEDEDVLRDIHSSRDRA